MDSLQNSMTKPFWRTFCWCGCAYMNCELRSISVQVKPVYSRYDSITVYMLPFKISFRCRRDFAPQGFGPPGARSLVIWPSPVRDPWGSRPPLGISPPPKVLGFRPPPFLRFRSSYFLYIIGVKNNGEKISHFDTCTNYSRCSQ